MPNFPLAAATRIPITPYWHAQPEIYYILEGEGQLEVDGVAYQVRKGDAIYVPGDALHTIKNNAADVLKILYVFPAGSLSEVQYKFPDGKERRLVAGENAGGGVAK